MTDVSHDTEVERADALAPAGQPVEAAISAVVVLEDRAQVTRTAQVELTEGRHLLIVAPVTPLACDASLRCSIDPGQEDEGEQARLLDMQVQRRYVVRPARPDQEREITAAMERLADDGKLRAYGVATWTGLRARPHERVWLGLAETVALAEDVAGGQHRFRAIQLPFNARMPEALTRDNQLVQGQRCSALQAARQLDMMAFVSGPLMQGRLALAGPRLAHDALQLARSAPGVASALVGMTGPEHVRANVALLAEPKLSPQQLSAKLDRS